MIEETIENGGEYVAQLLKPLPGMPTFHIGVCGLNSGFLAYTLASC